MRNMKILHNFLFIVIKGEYKGGGSRKWDDFKKRHPRTPCPAIDGVLPLQNLCTQVCNQYGGV